MGAPPATLRLDRHITGHLWTPRTCPSTGHREWGRVPCRRHTAHCHGPRPGAHSPPPLRALVQNALRVPGPSGTRGHTDVWSHPDGRSPSRVKPGSPSRQGSAPPSSTTGPTSPMELLRAVPSRGDHHTVPQEGPQAPVKGSVFLAKEKGAPVTEPQLSPLPPVGAPAYTRTPCADCTCSRVHRTAPTVAMGPLTPHGALAPHSLSLVVGRCLRPLPTSPSLP